MKAHTNIEAPKVNDGTKPAISFNNMLPAAASTELSTKHKKNKNKKF